MSHHEHQHTAETAAAFPDIERMIPVSTHDGREATAMEMSASEGWLTRSGLGGWVVSVKIDSLIDITAVDGTNCDLTAHLCYCSPLVR
jgi:hypothetical protein